MTPRPSLTETIWRRTAGRATDGVNARVDLDVLAVLHRPYLAAFGPAYNDSRAIVSRVRSALERVR